MTESPQCECIIDAHGLHEISIISGNLKPLLMDLLKNGVIGIYNETWNEFSLLYEDEAAQIKPHFTKKFFLKEKHYIGAASYADRLNSKFPRGAYDNNTDLYTATLAVMEKMQVLTISGRLGMYNSLGCPAEDLQTWLTHKSS